MTVFTAFIAAVALQGAGDAPGRYVAGSDLAQCALTLRPASAQPPESQVQGETAAGFAFAAPGCPGPVSRAALWRLSLADGVLVLADGAGAILFEGRAEADGWAGETPEGEAVTLRRR